MKKPLNRRNLVSFSKLVRGLGTSRRSVQRILKNKPMLTDEHKINRVRTNFRKEDMTRRFCF